MKNCQFVNNIAMLGGAIYVDGDNGEIHNSYFNNNSADEGGAIYLSFDGNII